MIEGAGWDCHVHVFDAAAPVLPGHYQPATRTLAQIEARAAADGVGHLVLVQPSVYGSDNTLLLRALQASAGRHRGVAVLAVNVTDAELDALHAAGVRGVRFNLVSPVGGPRRPEGTPEHDPAQDTAASAARPHPASELTPGPALDPMQTAAQTLRALAPRLRERGWHVQWYVHRAALGTLAAWQAEPGLAGLPFVLDHLAGIMLDTPADDPAWLALAALAAGGAWLKLSGWYRLGATAPYAGMQAPLARAAGLFGHRLVWGSDWPHTSLDAGIDLPYASTWRPVSDTLPAAIAEAVHSAYPLRLYG